MKNAFDILNPQSRIMVLTGAGISAESGIRTFRDSGGLWENHPVDDVASPGGFRRDPKLVWNFYKQRYAQALTVEPNPGHLALKKLEDVMGDRFWLVTQNVDGLHDRAGNQNLIEMHGSLHSSFCTACGGNQPTGELDLEMELPTCPACNKMMRPDIVWFGEMPYRMDEIDALLNKSNLLLVIGTSGVVYPAAGFVMRAKYLGAHTVSVNLDAPDNDAFFDEIHQGKAGTILPDLLDSWIEKLS